MTRSLPGEKKDKKPEKGISTHMQFSPGHLIWNINSKIICTTNKEGKILETKSPTIPYLQSEGHLRGWEWGGYNKGNVSLTRLEMYISNVCHCMLKLRAHRQSLNQSQNHGRTMWAVYKTIDQANDSQSPINVNTLINCTVLFK